MINVAIIENEDEAIAQLDCCLSNYAKEHKMCIKRNVFKNGNDFLREYKSCYNIVFMDVDMPEINGFEVAEQLRKIDKDVILVFVTNLVQYGIKGYQYDAKDYIIKPLFYSTFSLKLNRILSFCKENKTVQIQFNNEIKILNVSDIYYVEIAQHNIIYHTKKGNFLGYGTMKKVEESLPKEEFCRCNSCYLVNLKHVTDISGYDLHVGDDVILISHPKRKGFIEALHKYISGN